MKDPVYKILELVGSSDQSIEGAITYARRTKKPTLQGGSHHSQSKRSSGLLRDLMKDKWKI
jgi:flavin-binding protein dodecin